MTGAEQLRDEGMALASEHADPRVIEHIDRVIREAIVSGERFTADSIRASLPTVMSPGLVGARMRSYAGRTPRWMRSVGYTPSTHPATRRSTIRVWIGTAIGKREASS